MLSSREPEKIKQINLPETLIQQMVEKKDQLSPPRYIKDVSYNAVKEFLQKIRSKEDIVFVATPKFTNKRKFNIVVPYDMSLEAAATAQEYKVSLTAFYYTALCEYLNYRS